MPGKKGFNNQIVIGIRRMRTRFGLSACGAYIAESESKKRIVRHHYRLALNDPRVDGLFSDLSSLPNPACCPLIPRFNGDFGGMSGAFSYCPNAKMLPRCCGILMLLLDCVRTGFRAGFSLCPWPRDS